MKKLLAILAAGLLFLPVIVFAAPGDVTIDTETRVDFTKSDETNEGRLRLENQRIKISVDFPWNVQAVLMSELDAIIHDESNPEFANTYDWEEFLREAYIRIHTDGKDSWLSAIKAGKHKMAFGSEGFTKRAVDTNSSLYEFNKVEEVIGVTVKLSAQGMERIADALAGMALDLEVSVFENPDQEDGAGDLDMGDDVESYSARISAMIKQLRISASYANMEKASGDAEERYAIAAAYKTDKGIEIYGSAYFVDNNPAFDADWAALAGVSYDFSEKTSGSFEVTYFDDGATELVASLKQKVNSDVTAGIELGYTYYEEDDDKNELGAGVSLQINKTVVDAQNVGDMLSLGSDK